MEREHRIAKADLDQQLDLLGAEHANAKARHADELDGRARAHSSALQEVGIAKERDAAAKIQAHESRARDSARMIESEASSQKDAHSLELAAARAKHQIEIDRLERHEE
jgi:hypothetical protein